MKTRVRRERIFSHDHHHPLLNGITIQTFIFFGILNFGFLSFLDIQQQREREATS